MPRKQARPELTGTSAGQRLSQNRSQCRLPAHPQNRPRWDCPDQPPGAVRRLTNDTGKTREPLSQRDRGTRITLVLGPVD